jgi:hypothetical protein
MTLRPRGATLLLASAPLLSGCALFSSQIEVSRRYDQITNSSAQCITPTGGPVDPKALYCFEATVSALPAPAADSTLAVTGLSDRGQGAYIAGLAGTAKEAADLRTAVAAPLKAQPTPVGAYQDSSTIKLRFVLGLFPVNGYLNPGDRLAWAKVSITPVGPAGIDARFSAWTQAANAFEVIDVGSVTASRTDKVTAETGLNIAKFLSDTKVGAELSATREEKADIKDRVGIFATIKDGTAWIVQYGGWRRDLAGNSTFDASVTLSPADSQLLAFTTSGDLKSKTPPAGAAGPGWISPDKVMLGQRYVRVPKSAPLCARVAMDFVVRHIVSGDRSFSESNDRVQFIRGATSSLQDVAPPVIAERWNIVAPRTIAGQPAPLFLQFTGDDGQEQVLTFTDKGQALDFLTWMRASKVSGKVGNGTLFFKEGEALDLARYPGLDAVYFDADRDWSSATHGCKAIVPAPH